MRLVGLFAVVTTIVHAVVGNDCKIAPKVVVVTFFDDEGFAYLNNGSDFDFYARNITMPGASPQFPDLHCTADGSACVMTTGEGMVHATASIAALWNTPGLNLTETYFLTTGVAGGNPQVVSTCSVTFARFSIQTSMQYEIDAREKPHNFTTGYFPQGATNPNDGWGYVYNTEVFSVNPDLRDIAAAFVDPTQLVDSADAKAYRANYGSDKRFSAGTQAPSVVKCDVASSDTWFTGKLLANEVEKRMQIWSNGSAVYCATAQEDGAVLAALLRGALAGKVDYNRIIVMRTISDFDRPYPGQSVYQNLLFADTSSYDTSISNLYIAGSAIIKGIIGEWDEVFRKGVPPSKYTGDVWGTLGGTPDFGPGRVSSGYPVTIPGALSKRLARRKARAFKL